jgi:membrane protein implicated in regulation of membrane protease activity
MKNTEKELARTKIGAHFLAMLFMHIAAASFIVLPAGFVAMVWDFSLWRIPVTASVTFVFSVMFLVFFELVKRGLDKEIEKEKKKQENESL